MGSRVVLIRSSYARVSKTDGSQSLDLQRDALRAESVNAVNLYHDFASGVRDNRPGLHSYLRALRKGDVRFKWSHDQPPREWIRDYAAHQIFANAYYDFPNESPWTPYVGGGLGVAITTLHYANQFIRKPDTEYLRIDFEPDWPDAAKFV